MKRTNLRYTPLVVLAMIGFMLGACQQKAQIEPPKIEALEVYADPLLAFGLKYPSNWNKASTAGKQVQMYSSAAPALATRFVQFGADGAVGARIRVLAIPMEGKKLEEMFEMDNDVFEASVYQGPTDVTVAGMPAKKFTYGFELNDGNYYGEKYFVAKDSMYATVICFEAFGSTFEALRPKFDEMLASATLAYEKPAPTREEVAAQAEPFKPTEQFVVFTGDGYTIAMPDNFAARDKGAKGSILSSKEFVGVGGPADCTIRIDVVDASKQNNLDKLTKENKPLFNAGAPEKKTTLGEAPAVTFEYSASKDVQSRVYFVVKGEKFYRVVMNWYKPEKDTFLADIRESNYFV